MDNPAFESNEKKPTPPSTLPLVQSSLVGMAVALNNGASSERALRARRSMASIPPTADIPSPIAEKDEEVDHRPVGPVQNTRTVRSMMRTVSRGAMNLARQMTREALPHLDNYNHLDHNRRPTMDELHESNLNFTTQRNRLTRDADHQQTAHVEKFGWIQGVLIRTVLNIWGIMFFLRLPWVVSQAGIWQALIIICISTFMTLVTALSTSAITTNGEIGGGGPYYVMSRTIGPEWGGSIGILFALANAINGSLNMVGFVETLREVLKEYGGYTIVDGGDNDTRILGLILLIFVCAVCGLGAKYEMATQQVLLVILTVAFINLFVGSFLGPTTEEEEARGFMGYSSQLLKENWSPAYIFAEGKMQDFFTVLAIYFPSGIEFLAGANVSGNLKDPSTAIPKGAILSIIITSSSYVIIAIMCGATMKREASGIVEHLANETLATVSCSIAHNCTYGTYHDYQVLTLISAYAPLNYAGIFATSLSTALASYIACPKLLQVIGDDGLFPHWMVGFMTKGYGKAREPLVAYLFTFFFCLGFVLIAQLNWIAMLITDLFLITFAFLNYSCFHIDLVQPTGWRPTFKYYNKWLSLFNACVCTTAMFLIDWRVALLTVALVLFFYSIVVYRKPDVSWGSSPEAKIYREVVTGLHQLVRIDDHVKNFHPQILALTGQPGDRPALTDLGYLICKKDSMFVCSNILKNRQSTKLRSQILQKSYQYLRNNGLKGFCSIVDEMPDLSTGVAATLKLSGIGKVKPNILMMGFKNDWCSCDKGELDKYFATLHAGFDLHVSMVIVRIRGGLDYSDILKDDYSESATSNNNEDDSQVRINFVTRSVSVGFSGVVVETPPVTPSSPSESLGTPSSFTSGSIIKGNKKSKRIPVLRDVEGNELPQDIARNITVFRRKQEGPASGKGAFIDVWWLYDDGGLTLLLPYIIKTRSNWAACKLRIFCTASSHAKLEQERERMAALLAKFRISYSDLVILTDLNKLPDESTRNWFDTLIRPFLRCGDLSDREKLSLKDKTDRHLRLRELLMSYSGESNLVVMTLPMPRKDSVSAPMYLAWLEALTADMPPFLLIRGNQTSVLTFHA